MSSQTPAPGSHVSPFSNYRISCDHAAFLPRRDALAALQAQTPMEPAQFGPTPDGPMYRVTDFPDAVTNPLYVRGFYMRNSGEIAVFREAVEETLPAPEETRYVVLVQDSENSDWQVRAIVVGPTGDSPAFARTAIEHMIEELSQR